MSIAATITVGDVQLRPNEANQWFDVLVTGGDLVSGVDLFLQVGDGGPPLAAFGLPPGLAAPAITGVDLKSETIFKGVSDVATNVGSSQLRQTAVYTLALVGTTPKVAAQGLLAKIQMDTSGFFGGTWNLQLDNVLPFAVFGGPYATNFAGQAATIRNGTLTIPIARGDYNLNQQFDVGDINTLTAAIRAGSSDRAKYDLNADNAIDQADVEIWVHRLARTYFGDANLDGQFGTSDLVHVFVASTYEDSIEGNARWESGDWDGDGDFRTSDLVVAFQDAGYEAGPRPASPIPEPAAIGIVLATALGVLHGSRARRVRRPNRVTRQIPTR